MQNLKLLSDKMLLKNTAELVKKEREYTATILKNLAEIDRRKLYADLGYSSLFEYCRQELKYSESQSARRIRGARMLQEIPELEPNIKNGELSLANISSASSHIKKEEKENNRKFSTEEKKEIVDKIKGKSKREAEKTLLGMSSVKEKTKPEKIKPVTIDKSEVRFNASDDLLAKIERIKGLPGHQNVNTIEEVVDRIADFYLLKNDPVTKSKNKKAKAKAKERVTENEKQETISDIDIANKNKAEAKALENINTNTDADMSKTKRSRYVPAAVKDEVWARANGRCEYISPVTGKRCNSNHFLQLAHVLAYSKGGANTADNLKLHCANHNSRDAVLNFGLPFMEQFIGTDPGVGGNGQNKPG